MSNEIPESPQDPAAQPEPALAEAQPAQAPGQPPPEIPTERLDPDALKVVYRLRQFGHEAYFVGGCVRDLLLSRKPKDFDIATSAHPGEVRALFRNCRLIGRRFRLAHVYFKGGKIMEVSTFRANPTELMMEEAAGAEEEAAEGPLPDEEREGLAAGPEGAEPSEAEAGEDAKADLLISDDNVFGTAEQDARRRDFTINGLFYDVGTGTVVDYVHGRRDLQEKLIRTIGDPEIRMREDPVRILRAVRFACRLGFEIESRTYAAMEGAVEDLPRCAPPRLLEDTFRLIRGGVAAPGLKLLAALDALKFLLPPIDRYLKDQGRQNEERYYAFAEALDRKLQGGAALDDATMLATLLVPLSRVQPLAEPPPPGGRPAAGGPIDELLEQLVRTSRLPRRIAERCRLMLIAQKTLTGERRRRGSLASFRRHPLFNEALAVFELTVEATGQFKEQLEAWKSGSAPEPAASAEGPPKRRRRRRRGRGGGPRGSNEGSGEGAPSERRSQPTNDPGEG